MQLDYFSAMFKVSIMTAKLIYTNLSIGRWIIYPSDCMNNNKVYAIVLVFVLVVAAAGAYFVFSSGNDDYRSSNTDGRLAILGNADEDDYLDSKDIDKIKSMIENHEYSQMADANNDGVVDDADAKMVQEIIDLKKYNKDKADSEKKSMTINYISVDNKVLLAEIPVLKLIILNSQRSLSLAIAIDAGENVAALNDYIYTYWDENLFKNYKDLPTVGDRKEPSLEEILKTDADTIYAGSETKYGVNIQGTALGDKQVIRLVTYEDGRLADGALMLGFFTDHDAEAQKYVKWMDDLTDKTNEKLSKIADKDKTRFYVGTPTYMYAGLDGVSTALSASGATNIGNLIITDPTKAGDSVSNHVEDILTYNPQYIVGGKYIYTHQSESEIKAVYGSMDFSKFAITDGYINNEICMINYDLPFCIHTLIGSTIFFPEAFSVAELEDTIKEYLTLFCETNGYEFNMYNFVYFPSD